MMNGNIQQNNNSVAINRYSASFGKVFEMTEKKNFKILICIDDSEWSNAAFECESSNPCLNTLLRLSLVSLKTSILMNF